MQLTCNFIYLQYSKTVYSGDSKIACRKSLTTMKPKYNGLLQRILTVFYVSC